MFHPYKHHFILAAKYNQTQPKSPFCYAFLNAFSIMFFWVDPFKQIFSSHSFHLMLIQITSNLQPLHTSIRFMLDFTCCICRTSAGSFFFKIWVCKITRFSGTRWVGCFILFLNEKSLSQIGKRIVWLTFKKCIVQTDECKHTMHSFDMWSFFWPKSLSVVHVLSVPYFFYSNDNLEKKSSIVHTVDYLPPPEKKNWLISEG